MTTELGHVVMISTDSAAIIALQNSRVFFNDFPHYIIHILRFVETEDLEREVSTTKHGLELIPS